MLAEVLYRQGRYAESSELVGVCRELASPDDVTSQFLWRCVQAKLLGALTGAAPDPARPAVQSLTRLERSLAES